MAVAAERAAQPRPSHAHPQEAEGAGVGQEERDGQPKGLSDWRRRPPSRASTEAAKAIATRRAERSSELGSREGHPAAGDALGIAGGARMAETAGFFDEPDEG